MKLSEKAEEILEALWIATEEEGDNAAHLSTLGVTADDQALIELDRIAYVEVKGERVYLRPHDGPSPSPGRAADDGYPRPERGLR